jgi:hypothetical protein
VQHAYSVEWHSVGVATTERNLYVAL